MFQRDYAEAFDAADRVVISIVPDGPIYSATGEVTERFSAAELVADLCARKLDAVAAEGIDAIVADVVEHSAEGDVVLAMSNGAFDNVWERLLSALRA